MKLGYARVSTLDQSLNLQNDALKKAGCDRIFTDYASGIKAERPGLDDALRFLREGDTLVVWRLDRLGRSTMNMLELTTLLMERKINLVSLHEQIDTTTAVGKMFFTVMVALNEFERNLLIERTSAGLDAARKRGRLLGRPPMSRDTKETIQALLAQNVPVSKISEIVGLHRSSIYRVFQSTPVAKRQSAEAAGRYISHISQIRSSVIIPRKSKVSKQR